MINYNFKNLAKKKDVINHINSNENKQDHQTLRSMNPKLRISKNKKTMIINPKYTAKSRRTEKFIFKNIEKNIKNVKSEILDEERERANSCAWKIIITKVVYVVKPYT